MGASLAFTSLRWQQLLVVGPQAENLYHPLPFQNLIDEAMLDIETP